MGLSNLRLIVPVVYALAAVITLVIDRTIGGIVVVVGAILVGLFFVVWGRRRPDAS
ncbi:hypothetical protein [Microbispora sp. NBC_01389]|uniref:hypothetical protein n=1 Tax=Microbispora sp. NBC_01389 TaxID=2903584 RepID=UPI003244BCDB